MTTVEELLEIASTYLRCGQELLSRGDYHDAAEKFWAAVKSATMALTLKYMGRTVPPKGVSWRKFVMEAFLRAGVMVDEATSWAQYFIDVKDRLHGACFYGFMYEEDEHRQLVERAGEYLKRVRELVMK